MKKNLREIVFKALVDHLGVDSSMLSRIEGNEPIGIELIDGEEIFIYLNDDSLQTFIEIPVTDPRGLRLKATKLIDTIMKDDQVFLNIKKDKVILVSELSADSPQLDKDLSSKLFLFNEFLSNLKEK